MASCVADLSVKMSKTMSLAALRTRKDCTYSQSEDTLLQNHRPHHRRLRRAPPPLLSSARKRRRTTRGKPHSDPSALRCCIAAKQEPLDSAFLPRFDPFSVKIEPSEYQFLNQVPTFIPHEQLLICTASLPSTCELRHETFPSFSSFSSSPVSPLSSSPLFSSTADEFPGTDESPRDEAIGFVTRHDDTCFVVDSLLAERFYEIERTISGIMGEAAEAPCAPTSAVIGKELVVLKQEVDHSENGSDTSNGMSSVDTSTTATTQEPTTSEDVDYRIDLTDFEPDQEECAEAEMQGKRLRLTLNYDDVISEWSDRGPLFADGSWTRKVPEGCSLDLAEWEPDRVVPSTDVVSEVGIDGYQGVTVTEDGQSVVDEGGRSVGACGREARVMRYREKRRTRLFSKKIRYEIRKLNAERRPRMKGRFIKRPSD